MASPYRKQKKKDQGNQERWTRGCRYGGGRAALGMAASTPCSFEEKREEKTSLVGSLRYLTCTRPDILYAVGLVSRYMENPTTTHFKVAKRILRYIKGTIDFGLFYSVSNDYKLVGYSDSDWGGDINDRKSTSGNLLKELGLLQEKPTEICVDNKSAIALAKNPVFHDRSKHIDTRYHYIRECIAKRDVQMEYVKSKDQIADIFTKPLRFEDFSRLRSLLGMVKQV
ncbi:hypothetical protein ACOSQ3_022152 [Xanthoceras sorbifolium]